MSPEKEQPFRGVSLKKDLVEEVDRFIKEFRQYKSVADFVHEAVRLRMEEVRKSYDKMPRFQQLNSDEQGVKVWDNKLRQNADIAIQPSGITCSIDESGSCEHIMFALSIPEVRELVRGKRKKGWKLPDL